MPRIRIDAQGVLQEDTEDAENALNPSSSVLLRAKILAGGDEFQTGLATKRHKKFFGSGHVTIALITARETPVAAPAIFAPFCGYNSGVWLPFDLPQGFELVETVLRRLMAQWQNPLAEPESVQSV